jgi:hypothetical protein
MKREQHEAERRAAQATSSKLIGLLVVTGLAFGITASTLAASTFPRGNGVVTCTWGASSILVVDGKVAAGPTVTGCVP